MPETDTEKTQPDLAEATSKLGDLIKEVTSVDKETGKQANPWAMLIGIILIVLVIAGVGIAVTVSRRKAVKAQFELDKLKEEQDRKAAAANQSVLEEERNKLLFEVSQLEAKIAEAEGRANAAKEEYANELERLNGVASWDGLEVRRADP